MKILRVKFLAVIVVTASIMLLTGCVESLVGPPTLNNNHSSLNCNLFKTKCSINLSGGIIANGGYNQLIQQVIQLDPNTRITLYLAGNGGSADSMIALISALHKDNKQIHAVIMGNVYSAHAFLALSSHTIETTSPDIFLMVHHSNLYRFFYFNNNNYIAACRKNASTMEPFKLTPQQQACVKELQFLNDYYTQYILTLVKPYLSADELKRMNNGENVYIYSNVIVNRSLNSSK